MKYKNLNRTSLNPILYEIIRAGVKMVSGSVGESILVDDLMGRYTIPISSNLLRF